MNVLKWKIFNETDLGLESVLTAILRQTHRRNVMRLPELKYGLLNVKSDVKFITV